MSYTSWSVVFGEQPSAAKWNLLGANDASFNDGTGIFGLYKNLLATDSNIYKFSAFRSAAWTATGSAYGKVAFDNELYDTNSNFDSVTNSRYTAPVSGFYFFSGNAISNIAAGASVRNALYKNGSAVLIGGNMENGVNTTPLGGPVAGLLQLSATDYIELWHYGSASAGNTGATDTYLHGFLMCRT